MAGSQLLPCQPAFSEQQAAQYKEHDQQLPLHELDDGVIELNVPDFAVSRGRRRVNPQINPKTSIANGPATSTTTRQHNRCSGAT